MKKQLHLMLLLVGMSLVIFTGCKKEGGFPTTITVTNLENPEAGVLNGTFIATGGLNTSGTTLMIVEPVGTDSIHCTTTYTAKEGTFVALMQCSLVTMEGNWQIKSGSGSYQFLKGRGSLFMKFPPDPDVPAGALGTETQTGVVWLHP